MTDIGHWSCRDCGTIQPDWLKVHYCKACFGKRISQGKARGLKRQRIKVRKALEGVDIDAIHFNPRWTKKLKEAA